MATITFENGQKVEFEGNPTPQDVEEVAVKLGIQKPKPEQQKPSGGFVGGEVGAALGLNKPSGGFLSDIFQSTAGAVLGTAALPGRAIVSRMTAGADIGVNNANAMLAQVNTSLIKKLRELQPDDPKYQNLQSQIQENNRILGQGSEEVKGLQESQLTQKQIGGTALNAALTLGTGTLGAGSLLVRAAEGATIGTGYKLADNLLKDKELVEGLGTAALIGGAIPFGGTAVKWLVNKTGKGLLSLGQKIQSSVIRPSLSALEDGFNINTLRKYNLGGSLNATLTKTNVLMNTLGKRLKELSGESDAKVALEEVYAQTERSLLGSKPKQFGSNEAIGRILGNLKSEIDNLGLEGNLADVPTSQEIKRAAGVLGSWSYGFLDKDANATQKVYTRFYQYLRRAIEKTDVGPEMRAINQQLEELIPIANAVVRRIPVAERNNALSLTDVMGLIGTVIDPKVAMLAIINKGSKSGRVGAALTTLGSKLEKVAPKSQLGSLIFGK